MTRIVVIVGFVVAFAAGLVVGTRLHHRVEAPATRPAHRSGWLAAELGLTPTQQEQMKQIWSDTAYSSGRDREERRRQLMRQRDQAIAAIIRPEDKPKHDEILRNYTEQSAAIDREARDAFLAAVERTKQILTPAQRPKYDEFLRRHESQRERHRGDRDRGPGRRTERHGTTRPASQP